jgi:hypothetical protein
MSGMLVDSKNDCCCPEMRCCTPTTVTATVSGMAGQTVRAPYHYRPITGKPYAGTEMYECWVCNDSMFLHSIMDAMAVSGRPTGTLRDMGIFQEFFDWICFNGDSLNWWPPASFPPATAVFSVPGCEPFDQYGEPQSCQEAWSRLMTSDYGFGRQSNLLDIQIVRWIVDPGKLCEISGILCTRPANDCLHAGPCGGGSRQVNLSYEGDLNGTYVCHRPEIYVRPQLKARINRQVPLPDNAADSPYRGVTEAQLLYNVDPRRTWVLLGPPYECWDVMFPPEGEEYCVDYRCGKRNPWYSAFGFGFCVRGKCTTTNQGVVKPHVYYYHEGLKSQPRPTLAQVAQMQSADLYLRLIPRDYEADTEGRFPTWWRVGSVEVRDGGYGYSVGEFFEVDFDIRRPWLGGEIMTVFGKFDMTCMPPYRPSWVDEYGYTGEEIQLGDGTPAARMFQRLRISEVDENGAIVSVYVVPIFKNPEYKDPPLCMRAKSRAEQTRFYVGYGRVLCHPRSVQLPGIGYTVGDSIEFYCDDPPCEIIENEEGVPQHAIAVVSDVDEEGGILDWRIRGSDFPFGYATAYSCDETDGAGNCIASCFQRMPGSEPDQRGKYRWKANVLCDLTWTGVGVPARGANVSLLEGGLSVPCLMGHPDTEGQANTSNLTTLTIRVSRVQCETFIQVAIAQWPYNMPETGGIERVRALFPPFPRCAGGGAAVKPLFGPSGGNESDFGSYLAGGVVYAGGGGYCYRDKYHEPPTLPSAVPQIGGGSGATIAGYTFEGVHNFPNPAIDWGGRAPDHNRFSYFPVTDAFIGERGSGYEEGQTFEVYPEGGKPVSDMWSITGGDSPESCPNGAWYDGERATLNNAGYVSIIFDYENGQYLEPIAPRQPKCVIRISSVDENGSITGLEVVHGGMMFRTVMGVGKRSPSAYMYLGSTLGYGAFITGTFDTNYESDHFGELTGVTVDAPPESAGDPKHPGERIPVGGRDYADQSAGYFWMLMDTPVGGPVCPEWRLLAHAGWGQRSVFDPPTQEGTAPRNWYHESRSTHTVERGTMPEFVPRSSVCAFSDCYHSLLTRTYPLYKGWGGSCPQAGVDGPGAPIDPTTGAGAPCTPYALLLRKNHYDPPRGSDWVVIEHGPTLSLGHATPSPCPDHSNGTPTRE